MQGNVERTVLDVVVGVLGLASMAVCGVIADGVVYRGARAAWCLALFEPSAWCGVTHDATRRLHGWGRDQGSWETVLVVGPEQLGLQSWQRLP